MEWFHNHLDHNLAIPFALDAHGQWKDVSEVERGLRCGCLCPCCKGPLVAKKGEDRIHHFAHHDRRECRHALESSLFGMAIEILSAAGAALALPGHILRHELTREYGLRLSDKQEAAFFRTPWVIDPDRLEMPTGFHIHAQALDQSHPNQADLSAPDHKIAVHFLSHRKSLDQVRCTGHEPGWRVLAINLSYYVGLWWDTCDEAKDAKIAKAKAARSQMQRWLADEASGRGFVLHPESEEKLIIFRRWAEKKKTEQQRIEQQERERRLAHERSENAAWLIPQIDEASQGAVFYKPLKRDRRVTDWLARELGLKINPLNDAWVFAGAPGQIVPRHVRDYLANEVPWRVFPTPSDIAALPVNAPVKPTPVRDEIINAGIGICAVCRAPVDEVVLASSYYAGRRAQRCSANIAHPLKILPKS